MKNRLIPILVVLFLSTIPYSANAQKMDVYAVIDKHLESIAPTGKRSSIKSLIAVGEVTVEFLTQKNQTAAGRIVVASEGEKLFTGMSLNAADYPQEKIIFDGSKTSIALVRAGGRSVLGNFLQSNTELVSQGLFTGSLSTAWALLSTEGGQSRLSMSGTRKVNGRETYALAFSPKGGADVDITLMFDQETFRHVRTEYTRTSSASIGRTSDQSARQRESRIKVTEDFSDFKEFQGVTLPHKYKILYSISGGTGTIEIAWTCTLTEFAVNQTLDPASFVIPK